jgi:hypothetical protein
VPDFRTSFRKRLLDDPALSTALGSRIDWGIRPTGSPLPALCMHITSDPRPLRFGGRQELRQSRIQIDIFSDIGAGETIELAEAVILLIGVPFEEDGVRFEMPDIEGPETSGNQEERIYVHRARLDVLAWHALL